MKKFFTIICVIIMILYTPVNISATTETYSWFCVHRKDHFQPKLDPNISFIEDYNAIYLDKFHSDDCEDKVIYLTFDAGYENGNISKILDTMKKENVTGAFFILGNMTENEPELVKRMFNDGHLVCNHTFAHNSMINKSEEEFKNEIQKLENSCKKNTGYEISKFFRPPEGRFDETTLMYAQKYGYKTVFWSFAYADWDNNNQMTAEKAQKKIMENIHNGEIMLLHPTSATNANILGNIIRELKKQGYRFGTLDEINMAENEYTS